MLLALVALPARVSAAASQQTPSTVVIDTFPIFENQINVRQPHIAWLAAKEDAVMQTAIAYIASVNGSTRMLLTIHENFRQSQALAGMTDSHGALDTILQDFRSITQAIRDETSVQLKASKGKAGYLRISMQSALAASVRVRSLEDQYWHALKTTELADFDLWEVATVQPDIGKTEGTKAKLLQFCSTIQSFWDSYRFVLVNEDQDRPAVKALDITASRNAAL